MNPTEHWTGPAGDEYHRRQTVRHGANLRFFRNALSKAHDSIDTALEFGCGAGLNMRALREYDPRMIVSGVDINNDALRAAAEYGPTVCWNITQPIDRILKDDLVLTKGCLIHVPPKLLPEAYANIYAAAKRWILLAEYYAPRSEPIDYRGQQGLLWRGDFAGDMLDRFQDLELVDYGFHYHRDELPQDDVTWFLLRRK